MYREIYVDDQFYSSWSGTYEIEGGLLTLNFEYETSVYTFTILDNKLYLTDMSGAGTLVLTRES